LPANNSQKLLTVPGRQFLFEKTRQKLIISLLKNGLCGIIMGEEKFI